MKDVNALTRDQSRALWHMRLGHINERLVSDLHKCVDGVPSLSRSDVLHSCLMVLAWPLILRLLEASQRDAQDRVCASPSHMFPRQMRSRGRSYSTMTQGAQCGSPTETLCTMHCVSHMYPHSVSVGIH